MRSDPARSGARYAVRLFASLDAFADYASGSSYRSRGGDTWAGGTRAEAFRATHEGDLGLVAPSEALLARFESLMFPTFRREWIADVSGVMPNVPAYIAGHPASMRRRAKRTHEAAPVTVFVDLFASAAFTPAEVLARGAAVLALVRVLAAHRAVTLYVGCASTAYSGTTLCPMVQLNTTPLDLAHAAYALCGVGFLRRVAVAAMDRMVPGSSPWPPLRGNLRDVLAQAIEPGTQLLIVQGAIVSTVTSDPTRWIEDRIREVAPEVLGEAA